MKKLLLLIAVVYLIAVPVNAESFTAPPVPEAGDKYMPDDTQNFAEGLWYVISNAVESLHPSLTEAVQICASLIAVALLVALLNNTAEQSTSVVSMVGVCAAGVLLLRPVNSLIHLAVQTVEEITQYGKLLLPVMTGALAAQGSVTKSGALYAATVFFDTLLSSAITHLLTPLAYVFVCICIVNRIFNHSLLRGLKDSIKWVMSWGLKTVLYVFTGYLGITGVVSGTTDAAMLKATKLTISSMVPVVGGILSDASEAVLVSAGLMKNAAGIYGILAMLAVGIGPFLQIGVQYLMLKICAGICHVFGVPAIAGLVKDFSAAMGLLLAMIGTVCMMLLISTICFMRGAG